MTASIQLRPSEQRRVEAIKADMAIDYRTAFIRHRGKRMLGCAKNFISIPVGRRVRVVYRDDRQPIELVGVMSHETYNNWWWNLRQKG